MQLEILYAFCFTHDNSAIKQQGHFSACKMRIKSTVAYLKCYSAKRLHIVKLNLYPNLCK